MLDHLLQCLHVNARGIVDAEGEAALVADHLGGAVAVDAGRFEGPAGIYANASLILQTIERTGRHPTCAVTIPTHVVVKELAFRPRFLPRSLDAKQ